MNENNISVEKVQDIVNILKSYRTGFIRDGNLACNKMVEILQAKEIFANHGIIKIKQEKIVELNDIYIRS